MIRDFDSMHYKKLVNEIAKESGLYKCDVDRFLKAFTKVVTKNLKLGKKIYVKRFGVFFPMVAKSKVVNSRFSNGEMIIPEHMTYKFRFGKYFLAHLEDNEKESADVR